MTLVVRGIACEIHKSYLNGVYEAMGFWKANKDHVEILAILGTSPVPEYRQFSETTAAHSLKAALSESQRAFRGTLQGL